MADNAQHEQRNDVAEPATAKTLDQSTKRAANALLGLQRAAGNRAAMAFAQTKLVIGHAVDPAEQEADDIADAVLQRLRKEPAGNDDEGDERGGPPTIRRSAGGGDDPLGGAEVDPTTSNAIERARSTGRPLSSGARDRMESGFGQSFGSVRIHDGQEADRLSRSLQAHAFTSGRDIFFSRGAYRPGTSTGDQLLAHELAHVVQQGGSGVNRHVSRKMWTKAQFAKATSEGALTKKSDVQEQVEKMIAEYIATFEEHGVVSTEDLPKAVNLLLQMQQSVEWWIGDHTVDVDNDLGGVDTLEAPNRKKRMKGMKEFKVFLAREISTLQAEQRRQTKDDGSEGDITSEITEKSKGFLVLERKYTGDAKSFLEKIGAL